MIDVTHGAWKVTQDADKSISLTRGEANDVEVISGFFTGVLDAAGWVRAQGGHAYDTD